MSCKDNIKDNIMILIENFSQVIAQIESERGIEKHLILDAIEKALVSAAKKKYGNELNVKAVINEHSGEARLWMEKLVVSNHEDPLNELLLDEATELSDEAEIGDTLEIDLDIDEFGRIATQAAKQVILQCIREAEKDLVIREFSDKVGQIVTGTVQNIEGNTYLINLGKIEAFLPPREQAMGEVFNVKDRIRVFVVDIQKTSRGPAVKISRSHSGLIRHLFQLEVPEIQDGIITIKSISRDPGRRTKIAVASNNQSVGAVGTCVGHMGGRIQAVLREINNEKIDILEWSEDPRVFIGNSLKPATISQVIIDSEENREATVVVPDDQLSLAIGKSGQNVRLAVKLTNWKLDIMSDADFKNKGNEGEAVAAVSLSDKIKIDAEQESLDATNNVANDESSSDSTDTSGDGPNDDSNQPETSSDEPQVSDADPSNDDVESERQGEPDAIEQLSEDVVSETDGAPVADDVTENNTQELEAKTEG
jgi:N utilization substance protein A